MNYTIYILCQILTFLIVFFLVAITTYGLRRAYMKMGKDWIQQQQIIKWVFYGMVCWLLILVVLATMGFYGRFDILPPRIFVFAIFPALLLFISLLFSKNFQAILQHLPPHGLIRVQSFRIVMEIMLWLGCVGQFIPFQMTFLGFNMDIIVGLTAVIAAKVFVTNQRLLVFESIIWNLFGIFLLISVVFVATISTPAPFQIFKNMPDSSFLATPIFIWIPGFIVPYAIALHLYSVRQVLLFNKKMK